MIPITAFGETFTVTIPEGTSVPECEETDECYLPADLTINVGDTVEWVNVDTAAHTVTGGSPADGQSGVFDSSLVMGGESYSVTFHDEGSYDYFCMLHPWMVGNVTVEKTPLSSGSPENFGILGSEHTHSSILVKIFEDNFDFSAPTYQTQSSWIYFEGRDGFTIHKHVTGVTLGYLFQTLSLGLDDKCLVFQDGREFCTNEDYTLKFFINREQVSDVRNYEPHQDDRILIVYGSETDNEIEEYFYQLDNHRIEPEIESNEPIKIIGIKNHYSTSELIELQVLVSDLSFDCGDLYLTIYSEKNVVNQEGYFDQCFVDDVQTILLKEPITYALDSSGYYDIVAEMVSEDLKNISTKIAISVGDVNPIKQSINAEKFPLEFVDTEKDPKHYVERYLTESKYKEWFDSNYPDYTIYEAIGISESDYNKFVKLLTNEETTESVIPTKTVSFGTPITDPKSVQNWEFYDINTECQLKYFFFKDPSSAYYITSVIEQNAQRLQQEYFARGGQQVEYGDRAGLSSSHDLIREISGEILMEEFSINPVLKDKMSLVMTEDVPDYASAIQQGNHECEEEFRLYSDDYENTESSITKTPFTDSPENGVEVGQWVKLEMEFINLSDELTKQTMESQMSQIFGGVNFDLSDIEEAKYEIVDVSDNEISMNTELKISGKTTLYKTSSTQSFPNYSYFMGFIPTNVEKGNIIPSDLNFIELSVIDFPTKRYGGKNTETIHVGGSFEQKTYEGYVKFSMDTFYHKKTGMLMESNTDLKLSTPKSKMDLTLVAKAIDYYIPSEPSIFDVASGKSSKGGGCLIATATFDSELSPQVQKLREIRDSKLLQTESGTQFMESFNSFYYSFSPIIADYERENPYFKEMVKIGVTPLLTTLSLMDYAESESEVLTVGISLIILNGMMYVGVPAIGIIVIRRF